MHASLSIEKALGILNRENAFMPDIRVNVEASTTVTPKCHDLFGSDVVTG
jgi:hypothetical protein